MTETPKRQRKYPADLHLNVSLAIDEELNAICGSVHSPCSRADYVRKVLHFHFANISPRYASKFAADGPPAR
jgi:hypothetical protein